MVWQIYNKQNPLNWNSWLTMNSPFSEKIHETPAMNVWRNDEMITVTAELPGVSSKDIDISVTGDTFVIKGERKPDHGIDSENYLRQERSYGSFHRSIKLPYLVQPESVEANLKDGVLCVKLARSEADKPKKISITTES